MFLVCYLKYGPHFVHENARNCVLGIPTAVQNFPRLAGAALFKFFSRFLSADIFGDFGQSEPTNLGIGVDVTLRWSPSRGIASIFKLKTRVLNSTSRTKPSVFSFSGLAMDM